MKKLLTLMSIALLFAACSTPRYTYHFDHYDYNSGKKGVKDVTPEETVTPLTQDPALKIDENTLVASASDEKVYVSEARPAITKEEAASKLKALTRAEKKELKKDIKKYVKENKHVVEKQGKSGLSGDLKLAAIFGGVGILLMIVLGDLFWLGTIAFLVGVFFLVRYLINH